MNFKKRGRKKFTIEEDLSAGFSVRITEERVDFEAKAKTWKTVFSKTAVEYSYALYMLQNGHVKELALAVAMLYNCSRVLTDAELMMAVFKTMEKVDKKRAKEANKKKADESDEEILKSEQMLHKSIEENAKTKSGKKAVKKIMKNK
ncbi:MAG: hypothetical protein WC910_05220 [Bacteroidales bacterium]|jgi:hypothetical protein